MPFQHKCGLARLSSFQNISKQKSKVIIPSMMLMEIFPLIGSIFYVLGNELHDAINRNDIRAVAMCHIGNRINEKTAMGVTAVHLAASKADMNYLRFVLRKRPRPSLTVEDSFGRTPLDLAIRNGRLNHVILILGRRRMDPNRFDNFRVSCPLITAIISNQDHITEFLIREKEVNVNVANVNGRTPLMLAAQMNSTNIMELLFARGAKVDSVDKALNTALHYAAKYDRMDAMINLVFGHNADLLAKNRVGKTPKAVAHAFGNRIMVEKLEIAERVKIAYLPKQVANV